jgi:S-adenosylmethionine/arginine decarboxylase-like enzyme
LKPSAHLHLLVTANITDPPGPGDCEKVNKFMRGMVEHVRMKVMLEPVSAWCDEPGNEGITSTVILTTSHCAMHIWNLPEPHHSVMQFDLYSCAPFEVMEVFEYINRHFKVQNASYKFLDREQGFTEISKGEYRRVV